MKSTLSSPSTGIGLAVCIVITFGAAAIGSALTATSVGTWYPTLTKPAWNPPAGVFGPVWTALYLAMAIAVWRVWMLEGFRNGKLALGLYGIQLILNAAWSCLFFYFQQPGLAFLEIIVLWLAIGATTLVFFQSSLLAGWLFVPYWLWVTFASFLNWTIWRLNPPTA